MKLLCEMTENLHGGGTGLKMTHHDNDHVYGLTLIIAQMTTRVDQSTNP